MNDTSTFLADTPVTLCSRCSSYPPGDPHPLCESADCQCPCALPARGDGAAQAPAFSGGLEIPPGSVEMIRSRGQMNSVQTPLLP
jgi:hypothetical protein